MKLKDEIAKANTILKEGSEPRTVYDQARKIVDLIIDFERAVKGENGSNDPAHPDAQDLTYELQEMKDNWIQFAEVWKDNKELWFRKL